MSIGLNSGGINADNRDAHNALAEFQRTVMRQRRLFPNEGLRINLVFDIPGPIFQPDYVGVHAVRIDRRNSHLLVVASVPADLATADAPRFIERVLRETVDEARAYLAKRKQDVSLGSLESLVQHLIAVNPTASNAQDSA